MPETRRYIFKLYPTPEQAIVLHEQRKMMADLWNALKQRREDVYRREHRSLTFFDLTNEITLLRHECPEWTEVPAITAHRVAKWLTDAYHAFFRRVKAGEAPGYPKWRSRERATTIPLGTMGNSGWHFEQRDDNPFSWRLHYKSVTSVKDRSTWMHARGRMPARRDSESHAAAPNNRLGGDTERRSRTPSNTRLGGDTESAGIRWIGGTESADIRRLGGDTERRPSRLLRAENSVPVSAWRNADIIWRGGKWWLSVCVDIEPRRDAGRFPMTIKFDLLDDFASVNGIAETPRELLDACLIGADIDRLKSDRDIEFPRGKPLSDDEKERLAFCNAEIASLYMTAARKRRNALHVWTHGIVSRASDLTIIAPPVRQSTRTPRGDERIWGANVETVSELNRHVLSQAPMTAIQMLRYKAEEAGIRCDVIDDDTPVIAVGGDLVSAGKQLRRVRREVKRKAA